MEELLNDLISQLFSDDLTERRSAAYHLGEAGDVAASASLELFRAVCQSDDDTKQEAAFALAKIGRNALPYLMQGIASNDETTCYVCLHALRVYGGSWAKDAIAMLRDCARSNNIDNATEAIVALGTIGPEANIAISDLLFIIDNNPELCLSCLIALRGMGPLDDTVTLSLLKFAELCNRNGPAELRAFVLRTLADASSPNQEVLSLVFDLLQGDCLEQELESIAEILENAGVPASEFRG